MDSGSHGNEAGSTSPVANFVLWEAVPSTEEEDVERQCEALKRRRNRETVPEVTNVITTEKPPTQGTSIGVSAPRKLKEYIASIPAVDRRQELLDNYASPQEMKRFRKGELR